MCSLVSFVHTWFPAPLVSMRIFALSALLGLGSTPRECFMTWKDKHNVRPVSFTFLLFFLL